MFFKSLADILREKKSILLTCRLSTREAGTAILWEPAVLRATLGQSSWCDRWKSSFSGSQFLHVNKEKLNILEVIKLRKASQARGDG